VVVDDDPLFCEIIGADLEEAGFIVSTFLGGDQLLATLAENPPDVVILDYYLKDENGLDVCRRLREVSGVPVIMLTGLTDSRAVVACLEAGADDYVLKPYEAGQLLARIRAVLRRVAGPGHPGQPPSAGFGDITIDVVGRIVRTGNASAQFAEREQELLAALVREYPGLLDRERCSRLVLRRDWIPGDRAIDVLVSRVREKLRTIGSRLDILTLRGRGYVLRDPAVQPHDPS
jgi:two-component system response regulator MtrA